MGKIRPTGQKEVTALQWEALLSAFRFGGPEEMPYDETRYPIGEFEKDYNKIITSASFRRLQDKTQVFPLEKVILSEPG